MLNFFRRLFGLRPKTNVPASSVRPAQSAATPSRGARPAPRTNPSPRPPSPGPGRPTAPRGPSAFEVRLREILTPRPIPVQEETEPRRSFESLGIDERVLAVLHEKLGYRTATPVQAATCESALAKRNLLVSSATGSGKTFAFLLPLLHRLIRQEAHQALILSPTREIAIQTNKNLEPFLAPLGLTSALVIGGTDMSSQKSALRQYPQVLVATPGRLVDMLQSGLVWLQYTDYVVLDEADRMLDMGFEEELLKIHQELPGTHQTLLFSATVLPEVINVAQKYGSDYEQVTIGKSLTASDSITHSVIPVSERQKFAALRHILRMNDGKTIVFFNTIREAIRVTDELRRSGNKVCAAIHSGKSQDQRNQAIQDLREGRIRTLLGTDVAARGIDIPLVELVVNYDLPNNPEEYIHRIGRTGRAGHTGVALSLMGERDKNYLEAIERTLKLKISREEGFSLPGFEGGRGGSDEAPGRHGSGRPEGRSEHRHEGRGGRRDGRRDEGRERGGGPSHAADLRKAKAEAHEREDRIVYSGHPDRDGDAASERAAEAPAAGGPGEGEAKKRRRRRRGPRKPGPPSDAPA